MNKSGNSPIIYDFHAKSIKDSVYGRRNQASDHNFKGIPAEVVGVQDYEGLQCLDVKALINDIYVERDNLTLESITLKKVFVALPRSGGFCVKQPVAVGDIVRLCWAHRDLGVFLDGDGSSVDINVNEIAEIEDCWVELGFGTRKNHTSPSLKNLIIEGPETVITITPDGKVTTVTSGTSYIKSAKHTVDTDELITGNLTVNGSTDILGNLTVGGTSDLTGIVTASAGVLAASYSGTGASNVMLGNVTIGGIEVNAHTHVDAEGRITTPMQ